MDGRVGRVQTCAGLGQSLKVARRVDTLAPMPKGTPPAPGRCSNADPHAWLLELRWASRGWTGRDGWKEGTLSSGLCRAVPAPLGTLGRCHRLGLHPKDAQVRVASGDSERLAPGGVRTGAPHPRGEGRMCSPRPLPDGRDGGRWARGRAAPQSWQGRPGGHRGGTVGPPTQPQPPSHGRLSPAWSPRGSRAPSGPQRPQPLPLSVS